MEWHNKPLIMELDHINGIHTDNREDNLRLLCPNCHAQTPTYKAKNKGNGRLRRRKAALVKWDNDCLVSSNCEFDSFKQHQILHCEKPCDTE